MQIGEDSHLRPQDFRNNWDRKIIHCAVTVSFQAVEIRQMNGGNKDDGGFLKARMLADHLGKFKAVDLGHAYIHQYDSYIGFEQFLERILGRRCLDQILSKVVQDRFIAEQLARLVVDHENVHSFVGAHYPLNNAAWRDRTLSNLISSNRYSSAQPHAHRREQLLGLDRLRQLL